MNLVFREVLYIAEWNTMAFRGFNIRIIIRIALLAISLVMFSYCIVSAWYLRSAYAGILALFQIAELILYISRFTKNISSFLQSIRERDFNIHFAEQKGDAFHELYSSINGITAVYKKISMEKEIKQRYLETLIEHISFGIISFNENGEVILVNQSFLKLAGTLHLATLNQLQTKNKNLFDEVQALKAGQKKLIKLPNSNQIATLTLYATEFKLDDESYRLISAQNITNELSTTEIEAWQRLIKVLTHEIMNSISPIMSLSGTLHEITKSNNQESGNWNTLHTGLEAIKIRSEGLLSFTQRYRELTQIPSPKFQSVQSQTFIEHILQLVQPDLNKHGISLHTKLESAQIVIDTSLLEQAILNIIHNAMDALEGVSSPKIEIQLSRKQERVSIAIADNGVGIEQANLDKIFVPFFTTKQNGSGIGLALSRQIALLHGGEILVQSSVGRGTVFTIII